MRIARDGLPVRLGSNPKALLNALVLANDGGDGSDWDKEEGLTREELERVLPEPREPRKDPQGAVKNALSKLWSEEGAGLPIERETGRVKLPRDGGLLSVDLWEFLAHVAAGRYGSARKMVDSRTGLALPEGHAEGDELWRDTVEEFKRGRSLVLEAETATMGLMQAMGDTRRRLLKRSLLPWAERLPIEEVRDAIEPIEFPWRLAIPGSQRVRRTLQAFMTGLLEGKADGHPTRLLVVGGHGRGKRLAATAVFLLLTDWLDDPGPPGAEIRPVIYVDGRADSLEPGFATDAWLEQRLGEPGSNPLVRPIVIMPHADAFLAKVQLDDALGWRLFRECDVLLCCGERFYETGLKYRDYASHIVRLEPWGREVQDTYAAALFPEDGRESLESWRDADQSGMREELCEVPLHLTLLLPQMRDGSVGLEQISIRWRLLDQLARERLAAAHLEGSVDDCMGELGALAHRFYEAYAPERMRVYFGLDDLREFLELRDPTNVSARLDAIVDDTMIAIPAGHVMEYRFEQPIWASFFTALYLAGVVRLGDPGARIMIAFDKPFSPQVVELYEEMLRDRMPRDGDRILGSLRRAFLEDEKTQTGSVIAREQVGYLLAVLGDEVIRDELKAMLEADAPPVSDPIVRHKIASSLEIDGPFPRFAALTRRDGT